MTDADEVRIMSHVAVLGDCWLWTLGLNNGGYAATSIAGEVVGVHRAMYEHRRGPIPPGMHIDHLCRMRSCVNPDHMEVVTCAENNRRGIGNPHKNATHCWRGHALAGDNLLVEQSGGGRTGRRCRECRRIKERAYAHASQ